MGWLTSIWRQPAAAGADPSLACDPVQVVEDPCRLTSLLESVCRRGGAVRVSARQQGEWSDARLKYDDGSIVLELPQAQALCAGDRLNVRAVTDEGVILFSSAVLSQAAAGLRSRLAPPAQALRTQSRQWRRVGVARRHGVTLHGASLAQAVVTDLSEGGVGVTLAARLPLGPLADPDLSLQIGNERIAMAGASVLRCYPAGSARWRVGMRWGPLDEASARRLRCLLNHIETDTLG